MREGPETGDLRGNGRGTAALLVSVTASEAMARSLRPSGLISSAQILPDSRYPDRHRTSRKRAAGRPPVFGSESRLRFQCKEGGKTMRQRVGLDTFGTRTKNSGRSARVLRADWHNAERDANGGDFAG